MLDYIYILLQLVALISDTLLWVHLPVTCWGRGYPEKWVGWFGNPGLKKKKQRENICPRSSTGRAGDL